MESKVGLRSAGTAQAATQVLEDLARAFAQFGFIGQQNRQALPVCPPRVGNGRAYPSRKGGETVDLAAQEFVQPRARHDKRNHTQGRRLDRLAQQPLRARHRQAAGVSAQCGHDTPYTYCGDSCSRGVTTARQAKHWVVTVGSSFGLSAVR